MGTPSTGKWFSNHGQAVQMGAAVVACLVALVANWPAIQAHQDVLAWWPVVVMPLAVLIAFRLGRSSRPTGVDVKAEMQPLSPPVPIQEKLDRLVQEPLKPQTYTERFVINEDRLIIAKQSVKLGDYWEIGTDLNRLKIVPISFKDTGVEIRFDTQGSMFYGGSETKETGVNSFIISETRNGFQAEASCAYQFSFSEKHVHFKILRVDHINKVGNEVVLEFCTVQLRKTFA